MKSGAQSNRANSLIGPILDLTCNRTPNTATYLIASSSYSDNQSRYDALYSNCNFCNPVSIGSLYYNASPCYCVPFFINERKTHYYELNEYVFRPLAFLQSAETTPGIFQNFFDRFRFMVYNPLDSIHRDKALMHMQKDAPNLPSLLQSFFTDVESLNNNVETFETLVNNTISNAFRKNPEAIIPEYYRYYFERVRDVAMSVWNQVLNENPHNVSEAIRNLPIEDLHVDMHDNIIRLRGFLVGEGNDEEKSIMRNIVFNKIIKNETLIEQILDLNGRRPALNTRMNAIKNRANEISSTLENGTISGVKCCPTIWNLIEKYVL